MEETREAFALQLLRRKQLRHQSPCVIRLRLCAPLVTYLRHACAILVSR